MGGFVTIKRPNAELTGDARPRFFAGATRAKR